MVLKQMIELQRTKTILTTKTDNHILLFGILSLACLDCTHDCCENYITTRRNRLALGIQLTCLDLTLLLIIFPSVFNKFLILLLDLKHYFIIFLY